MKVKELSEKLSKLPENLEVIVYLGDAEYAVVTNAVFFAASSINNAGVELELGPVFSY